MEFWLLSLMAGCTSALAFLVGMWHGWATGWNRRDELAQARQKLEREAWKRDVAMERAICLDIVAEAARQIRKRNEE